MSPPTLVTGESTLAGLLLLEDNLAALVGPGGVAALAVTEEQFGGDVEQARVRAVHARLWRLGYLDADVPPEQPGPSSADAKFIAAVRAFQREAAISVDGWVGPETWGALQALVSLDEPLHAAAWHTADGERLPAFTRALRLRLSMLGFFEAPPSANPAQKDEEWRGLEAFRAAATELGMLTASQGHKDLLQLVFDHGRQVQALAKPQASAHFPLKVRKVHHEEGGAVLLATRVVQWELWLSGAAFPSTPATGYDWDVASAIQAFWNDDDHGVALKKRDRKRITSELIQFLLKDNEEPSTAQRVSMAEVEEAALAHVAAIQDFIQSAKKKGFQLWNAVGRSIRRLAQWTRTAGKSLRELVSAGGKRAKAVIQHLARWVWGKAAEYVTTIRLGVQGLMDWLTGHVAVGEPLGAAARVSHDFDTVVVVGADGSAELLRAELAVRARRFELACRVVAAAIAVLGTVALAATGAGWPVVVVRVVTGLRRHHADVMKLGRELAAPPRWA